VRWPKLVSRCTGSLTCRSTSRVSPTATHSGVSQPPLSRIGATRADVESFAWQVNSSSVPCLGKFGSGVLRSEPTDGKLTPAALLHRFNLVNHNHHGVDTAKYGSKEE
jgi:hypothetical protein